MNTYPTLQQKMVGLAFIVGPLLTILGSVAYILGIGLSPLGTDSWVDGTFAAYGFLIMIPNLTQGRKGAKSQRKRIKTLRPGVFAPLR